MDHRQKLAEWETELTNHFAEIFDCTISDAQGVLEVNQCWVAREWWIHSTPEQAAQHINDNLAAYGDKPVFLYVPVRGMNYEQQCIPISEIAQVRGMAADHVQWAHTCKYGESITVRNALEMFVLVRVK
jgi:hypothetical protein